MMSIIIDVVIVFEFQPVKMYDVATEFEFFIFDDLGDSLEIETWYNITFKGIEILENWGLKIFGELHVIYFFSYVIDLFISQNFQVMPFIYVA